ncbi:DNA-binding PadR family transcriptional regulator [Evansella vedderi]|uniref:DNA-binding PadR family transcriptional regulator n=1 Tax=Evansella vedderi TaxID=38282 RepID=A0ABT9ZX64_9BACI|nr:helix-turn-helix transcriptional regulator [Evansella vedderi]MDQ0255459.1 DNA-binding PadR family transcriptional regulator [Evansella vedderi]
MESVAEKTLTEGKLGLTRKEVIKIYVLRELKSIPRSTADLYKSFNETYPLPKREKSRSYVYKTVQEMEIEGLIAFNPDGRKKIFSLTNKGEETYNTYFSVYGKSCERILIVLKKMRDDARNQWKDIPVVLEDDDRKYISKLIDVASFIQYVVLKHLHHHNRRIHGYEVYQYMKERYSWTTSDSYFYEVIKGMVELAWIEGEWDDDYRRSKRMYVLTDLGREPNFSNVEDKALYHIDQAYKFVKDLLSLFDKKG